MRMVDIYPEASEYLATNDQAHIFRVSGRAAEYLANKGDWDILKGYIDLPIQNQNLVILPWQVDVPLKFTINNVPAFSRDRLFEFTLNGFGSNGGGSDRTETSWEDRGFVPTLLIPPPNGFRVTVGPSAVDFGKKIVLQGRLGNNHEVTETLVIDGLNWVTSIYHYQTLTDVTKDITQQLINIFYIQPPPPNDNFAQAQLLVGENHDPNNPTVGTTVGSTVENGEPVTNNVFHTVWYKWVGVDNNDNALWWTLWTHIIEVFTGSALSNLVLIATSSINPAGNSAVTFDQVVGTTYWIRLRPTVTNATQSFTLAWTSPVEPPPPGAGAPDTPDVPSEPAAPGPPLPPQQSQPPNSILMSSYYPIETHPRYRMIRLSKTGYTARFLFRRKVFKIYTMDDFIPIQSELGFLTMLQAIQALRRKDFETAKAAADAAVEITTDAQRATTGFIELANQTEVQSARNYQIFNRDSVIMLDIFDDVAKIAGNVGQFKIFDITTLGLEALCAKGHWDGLTGYVDITVDGRRNVTLPRFVDEPIAIAVNGRPAYMRNKWSEFHLNGPGSDEYGGQWMGGSNWTSTWGGRSGAGRWGQIHAWDSVGEVCTIKPLGMPSQLVAIPDNPLDDGSPITIFGYDQNGKWIRSNGQDGFVVITDHNKLVPVIAVDQVVARIVRITRTATTDFVRLYAFDNMTQTTSVMLGYYYPDETVPQYFRIKLPADAHWIRMRYRKRTLKVTSVWQPLHLYSKLAIVTMIRSFKALETDAAQAEVFAQSAVKFLDEDQKARNPGETFQLQFNEDAGWGPNFIVS